MIGGIVGSGRSEVLGLKAEINMGNLCRFGKTNGGEHRH